MEYILESELYKDIHEIDIYGMVAASHNIMSEAFVEEGLIDKAREYGSKAMNAIRGYINKLIAWVTKLINKVKDWINSHKGKKSEGETKDEGEAKTESSLFSYLFETSDTYYGQNEVTEKVSDYVADACSAFAKGDLDELSDAADNLAHNIDQVGKYYNGSVKATNDMKAGFELLKACRGWLESYAKLNDTNFKDEKATKARNILNSMIKMVQGLINNTMTWFGKEFGLKA